MPYRPKDIYRGRRKFRVPLNIFLFVLAFLLVGGVTMFYVLQRYMVYGADGATLQLPSFGSQEQTSELEGIPPEPTFEPVQVQVIWEDPDFEDMDLGGWEDLEPIQGMFYSLNTVTSAEDLAAAVSSMTSGSYTTAVFEMKSASGQLAWPSDNATARDYATSGPTDMTETIQALHEAGKTVAAQISCFSDNLMVQRNWTCALQYSTGGLYQDSNGNFWVDPYNHTIRSYLTDLARELAAMGFDEIILADLIHPVAEQGFGYSVVLQTEPDPVVAVCQMGRRIVDALQGTGVAVSARISTNSMRNGLSEQTGQDIGIFWRLFARLYCPTTIDMVATDRDMAAGFMEEDAGSTDVRFVPITGYTPEDSPSYILG